MNSHVYWDTLAVLSFQYPLIYYPTIIDGRGMLGLDIIELESAWLLVEEEETVSSV